MLLTTCEKRTHQSFETVEPPTCEERPRLFLLTTAFDFYVRRRLLFLCTSPTPLQGCFTCNALAASYFYFFARHIHLSEDVSHAMH